MYATIIVPIDISHVETGKKAITIAQKLLDKDGTIFLVNVVEDIPTYVAAELPIGLLQESKEQALSELKAIAKAAGTSIKAEVRSGRAASSVLDAAEEHDADLIIVASHRPGLSDYFLGSTASRVVRHAQCPVFIDR